MVTKRLLRPERLRAVPSQFSWLDHRLVRERYLDRCSTEALALYLFLVTVADAKGRVEAGVGYVKKNLLAGLEIAEFSHINPTAQEWLETVANVRIHGETRRRPVDLFEEERALLQPLPATAHDFGSVYPVRGHTTKCWTQSVRIDRRPTSIGLGRYPVVTLALARQRALENAQAIAEGRDPRRRAARTVPTFAEACETVIGIHAPNWKPGGKNEQNWRSTMRDYVLPKLASVPVDAVTGTDVMAILLPIWTVKTETAGRVRRRIGAVMKWAVAQGYRTDNPAGDAISAALPNNNAKITHRQALPHAEVGAAVVKVRLSGAYRGAVFSLEFLVLTAARSAEVRGATWDEIDLEAAVWAIRAERMKAAREHRVPLSDRALALLDEARELPWRTTSSFRRRRAASRATIRCGG